jgi:hypothetical protein
MREADIREAELIHRFADYLHKVLPQSTSQKETTLEQRPKLDVITPQTEINDVQKRRGSSDVYKTPKRRGSSSVEIEDEDDGGDAETIHDEIASPYLTPNRRFFDNQYGIRRYGGRFMIGNSAFSVDETRDTTINGKRFRVTKGLWELLTLKNFSTDVITPSDLKRYKRSLEMPKAHLVGNEIGGDIQISRGSKFTKVISKLFPQSKCHAALQQRWVPY